jgi:hypothetical protein
LIPTAPNLSKVEGEVQGTGLVTQGANRGAPGGYGDLVLNVPIVEGVAAVRGVAWVRHVDGYFDRTYGYIGDFGTGPHPIGRVDDVGAERTWGFRGFALIRPIDKLDLSKQQMGFKTITQDIDTTSAGGRLIFAVFGAIAEFEREIIRGADPCGTRCREFARPPRRPPALVVREGSETGATAATANWKAVRHL